MLVRIQFPSPIFNQKNLDNFPQFATFLPHPITTMTNEDLTQIESSLDNCANELLKSFQCEELAAAYYAFSDKLQDKMKEALNSPVKQKTKKEILEEVFQYYAADPSRRATNAEGSCRYLMEDGRKCAVGRCLIEGKKICFGGMQKDPIFAEIQVNQIDNLDSHLLPEYRGHSVDFWQELQYWHDYCGNFTETGLSEKGERDAKFLLNKFADK